MTHLLGAVPCAPGALRPGRLQPGMTIGVVAPSSALRDSRLEPGMEALRARGYRVVAGEHLYDQHGYLAGLDRLRAADVTAMFARSDVDAVFCARGGYGAIRLLDWIDWDVVRAHPKPFVGFSDITTLHLALERAAGLVSFHGPMVVNLGGDLSETARDCFWRMLERAEPFGIYDTSGAAIRTLVGGKAEGRLAGGCLSICQAALGSAEQPDFRGRLVLIEDVGEAAYKIDRMLTHFRRSGLFEGAAGFIVGNATDWDKGLTRAPGIDLEHVWREQLAPLGKPAIVGFPFGHEPNPLTLPLGCLARLDADAGTVEALEPAVA
jgi:muramoyltetrapeptide carboxypeptidase